MPIHLALASFAASPRYGLDAHLLAERVGHGRQSIDLRLAGSGAIVAVAGGLPPRSQGSRASRLAIDALHERLSRAGDPLSEPMVRSVQRSMGDRVRGMRGVGMCTTLAALQIRDGAAIVVNVGDSPVFRWRDGFLCQKSVDHTVAQRMVNEGIIERDDEMAAAGHYDNLDSALYADPLADRFDVHEARVATRPGDLWLVCSRGMRGALGTARMAELVRAACHRGPVAVVSSLAAAAAGVGSPAVDGTVAAILVA